MPHNPEITLNQITARAAERSFQRGRAYHEDGMIYDTLRRG